jgi:hypothetical protein
MKLSSYRLLYSAMVAVTGIEPRDLKGILIGPRPHCEPCELPLLHTAIFETGSGEESRTPIRGFRDRCPAIGRHPNKLTWLTGKDSNLDKQSQNLLSYH